MYSVATQNTLLHKQALFLSESNIAAASTDDCAFLLESVRSWVAQASYKHGDVSTFQQVEWVQLLPIRCNWQDPRGYLFCDEAVGSTSSLCDTRDEEFDSYVEEFDSFVNRLVRDSDSRPSAFSQISLARNSLGDVDPTGDFVVRVLFNESRTIAIT